MLHKDFLFVGNNSYIRRKLLTKRFKHLLNNYIYEKRIKKTQVADRS